MKYLVVGYDSFEKAEFPVGTYDTQDEAFKVAKNKSGIMTLMYVYDTKGDRIAKFGTY